MKYKRSLLIPLCWALIWIFLSDEAESNGGISGEAITSAREGGGAFSFFIFIIISSTCMGCCCCLIVCLKIVGKHTEFSETEIAAKEKRIESEAR